MYAVTKKVGPKEIRTQNLELTVHTLQPLQPLRYLAERRDILNGLQDQVTTRLMLSPGDCNGGVRIKLTANFLYFLYFYSRSELISDFFTNIGNETPVFAHKHVTLVTIYFHAIVLKTF